jgi:hypothetical protein
MDAQPSQSFSLLAVIGAVASIGSAVVAAFAARAATRAARAAEQSTLIQKRALSMEAAKHRDEQEAAELAEVTIEFTRVGRGFPSIRFTNLGPATVYDLSPTIDGTPFADSEDILLAKGASGVVRELPPGSSYGFDYYLTAMTPDDPRMVKATWRLAPGGVGTAQAVIQP